MAVLKNRAKMSTSTTGTGTITLGSAEDGYQTFADAGVANADVVRYVIEDTGGAFEIGTGTYTSSGTTLSRTVSESSNSNNAINLSGSATVFIGATAEDIELSGNMAGDISSNGHAIKLGDRTGSGANELIMGAGDDFKLYHNGSTGHSIISETGSGNLQIAATNIELKADSGHALLTATYGGSVDLYHNSSKKAETTSSGLQTTGTLNVNGAYTLPTSDGSANQVLTTNGSGAVTFADAGGGGGSPDLFAENYDGTSTKPVASGTNAVSIGRNAEATASNSIALGFDAVASASLSFAALDGTATGVGSIAIGEAAVAGTSSSSIAIGRNTDATGTDAMALGSNAQSTGSESVSIAQSLASGNNSLAAVIDNNTSTYGAGSANSIAMGRQSKAGNINSVSIGSFASANGESSYALGYQATAESWNSVCIGANSKADRTGKIAFAAGVFAVTGDAQGGQFILRRLTTDATPKTLSTTGGNGSASNQIVANADTCIMFSGTLVAMQNGAQDQGGWEIKGLLKNDGGTTTLVSSNIQTFDDGNGWTVALSADNTNNALAITCTGEAAHNIRWVANIQTSEVTYA